MASAFPPGRIPAALEAITTWRSDPDASVFCPICRAPGLKVVDRSTRPYAEWYALSCAYCGLDHTIQIPLAPPHSSGPD